MHARFAFTAQFWGNGAVVCRAVEDRPGPIVEQQFGEFPSWTQAQTFASKLNEGLYLDPLEVRQIVTSSLLAMACVIQGSLNSRRLDPAPVIKARAVQLDFILAELALAITFCNAAHTLPHSSVLRGLLQARKALQHSAEFLKKFRGGDPELAEVASRAEMLDASIQSFLPFLTSAPSPATGLTSMCVVPWYPWHADQT